MTKSEIRTEVRRATARLDDEIKQQQSAEVVARLLVIAERSRPSTVALFQPMADEIDIAPLAERMRASSLLGNCRIVMPCVSDLPSGEPCMEFRDFDAQGMVRGAYGIYEPAGGEICPAEKIDIMIVPGVAFTREGVRLGRGRGYYDRYMAREEFRALCVGVCFRHQLYGSLPREDHDLWVDVVVTGGK